MSPANKIFGRGWIVLGCLLGVSLAFDKTEAQDEDQGPPPAPVKVQEASLRHLASVFMAPGTIVSLNDARIAAEYSGRLTWVADVGDEFETGQVIAKIDDTSLMLELRNDDATIRRLESNLRYMSQQVDRLDELTQQNIAARNELDNAISQRDMAEQDLVMARIGREQTMHAISQSKVKAPFSGQIVERMRQKGEFISVGGEIARLVDTRDVEVVAHAPMSVAQYLNEGLPVTVSDDAREVQSSIRSVIPVGDDRSRLIEVRVEMNEQVWVIGSAVQVGLPESKPVRVVAVPRDALILRQNSTFLYKVNDQGVVEQIDVQTGVGNGAYIEVRGQVEDGDQVVVRGGERLRPGQAVTINGG